MARARWRSLAVLALAALVSGCAHYVPNEPLDRHEPGYGYRFANLASPEAADEMLVIVTFSGGGTRAAALAYGVLAHLADTGYSRGDRRLRLLDEVDIISSVSGGSFTAAYYALHGERMFSDFEDRFLKRDVQGAITRKILAPVNLIRGAAPKFGRADLAAELFDEEIFAGATYGDLVERGRRPFVLINASDMTLGTRFEFTQAQFDLLCSDLSSFPLARAVAASSAVPIVFSPLTLRNYAGRCGYAAPPPSEGQGTRARQVYKAAETRSYLDGKARPFLHLLDGGLTDNTGLRGMLDRVAAHRAPHGLIETMGLGRFSRAVLIIVNAETTPDLSLDRSENVPKAAEVFRAIKDIPINRYSFETIELFKASLEGWARQLEAPSGGRNGEPFDVYLVEVNFDAIQDPAEREAFRMIPTSFTLPEETVDRLRALGPRLLEESSEYQRLLRDLRNGWRRPAGASAPGRRRLLLCGRRLAGQHAA